MRRFLCMTVLAALLAAPSWSETPVDSESVELIVVGPGDPMYTYWGHIGIAVGNRFYDFGNFSFHSDNFYQDFAMGRMIYLGMVTPRDVFITYSLLEDRDLIVYPLNLGDHARSLLESRLQWWMREENREYLYDYFLNNCSTIIRDVLDEATGGALQRSSEVSTGRTFRHYARTGTAPSAAAELLVHYLLGPAQDEVITGWEEMFLPVAVAEWGRNLEYPGEDGAMRRLVGEPRVLKSSTRAPVPDEPRRLWPGMLSAGFVLAALWWLAPRIRRRGWGRLVRALIIAAVGTPGAVLGFLMAFTDHAAAYGNINLWPTFPTVLAALIPLFTRGIRDPRGENWMASIWSVNLLGLVAATILAATGVRPQDAVAFWALLAPVTLAASWPGLALLRARTGVRSGTR